jgi:tRNA dimethylallyltransferase
MLPKETNKPIALIITGPTASGKSAVALQIAQVLGGEIVSADSMQIYRGLDIGTAKATLNEQQLVPHHLIDICEPDEYYSVAAWKKAAIIAIDDILARGRLPIICGGTGQYISALVDGLTFAPVASDNELRERLNDRAKKEGTAGMLREIAGFDPVTASRLHENDHKRIIRAIEIHHLTGQTISEINEQSRMLALVARPKIAIQSDRSTG